MSAENEIAALKLLLTLCREGLNKYPQSYEEDLEKLKDSSLTYNERNCIIFRSGEKRVSQIVSNNNDRFISSLLNLQNRLLRY